MPAWSARPVKSKRHRPCGQMLSATPMAASIGASARPCSTCSSTNAPIRPSRSSSGPSRLGSAPAARHRRGQRDPVVVAEAAGGAGFDGPGHQAAPQARHPEPGALLLGEDRDGHGPFGIKVPGFQLGHGGQRGRDPERSVVAPAVGDRIQVAAGDDGILPGRVPRTPPGPQVAVAVLFHGQAEAVRLAGEPGPALGVGRGPGVAAVAGGPRVAAQRLQLPPQLGEAHCSAIGTRTPRWVATSAASS